MSYFLTTETLAERSSSVLHPRHKLQYFRKQGWEDAWVTAAEIITRTTWEDEYKNVNTAGDEEADMDMQSAVSDSVRYLSILSLLCTHIRQ